MDPIVSKHLIDSIKDYQLTHGSLLKLVAFDEETTVPARPVGVSALPTRFPKWHFEKALQYTRVASDETWLRSCLEPLLEHDGFLASLWDIFLHVKQTGIVQPVVSGIFRSDYMLQRGTGLKQVEINTFSVAEYDSSRSTSNKLEHLTPCSTLKAACQKYNQNSSKRNVGTCVLMVVQPRNFNIADERPIEYGLWDNGVPCFRCEWQTVSERTSLSSDRTLFFHSKESRSEFEVGVVYYRAGYDAAEYDEAGRLTRLRLELSRAIKCPDVLTHLTTFKTVQQCLTQSGAVERFLPAEQAVQLEETFVEMQTLREGIRKVNADPELAKDYVLKPNLEGGGHNIYGRDIPDFLSSCPEEDWKNYILMRKIETPEVVGTLLTSDEVYQGSVISELGVLGACLWQKQGSSVVMLSNDTAGWTFKTKPADVDEMSVVKGYGCFDCPELIVDSEMP